LKVVLVAAPLVAWSACPWRRLRWRPRAATTTLPKPASTRDGSRWALLRADRSPTKATASMAEPSAVHRCGGALNTAWGTDRWHFGAVPARGSTSGGWQANGII